MSELTEEQFHKLQHAIGIEWYAKKKFPKRYEAFRNRYYTGTNRDPSWDELVELGYADVENQGGWWYFVTEAGMKYVGKQMGCEIIERK